LEPQGSGGDSWYQLQGAPVQNQGERPGQGLLVACINRCTLTSDRPPTAIPLDATTERPVVIWNGRTNKWPKWRTHFSKKKAHACLRGTPSSSLCKARAK